jgi:hypothetical protein
MCSSSCGAHLGGHLIHVYAKENIIEGFGFGDIGFNIPFRNIICHIH